MSYPPFEGNAWAIHKAGKKDSLKLNMGAIMIQTAALCHLRNCRSDANHVLFELLHYSQKHRVLNVSKALGERLAATSFELAMECMHIPAPVFEICFEDGLKVPDTDLQMPSCFIQCGINKEMLIVLQELAKQTSETYQRMLNEALRSAGQRPVPVNCSGVDVSVATQFSCMYHDPFNENRPSPVICTCNLKIGEDEGKTADVIIDTLPLLQGSASVKPMDARDRHVQKHVLRAVIGTLMYLNTQEPDIQPYKFHDRPKLGSSPPSAFLIGGKMERMPPGYHLREAHMRTLRHPRFKRDDAGKAKVIWINMTEVGIGRPPSINAKRDETDVS